MTSLKEKAFVEADIDVDHRENPQHSCELYFKQRDVLAAVEELKRKIRNTPFFEIHPLAAKGVINMIDDVFGTEEK